MLPQKGVTLQAWGLYPEQVVTATQHTGAFSSHFPPKFTSQLPRGHMGLMNGPLCPSWDSQAGCKRWSWGLCPSEGSMSDLAGCYSASPPWTMARLMA